MIRILTLSVAAVCAFATTCAADESQTNAAASPAVASSPGTAGICRASTEFHDMWIRVGERVCLKCHVPGGEAADSQLLLQPISELAPAEQPAAVLHNCDVFSKFAAIREADGQSRLLVKATGGADHGGGAVLKAESSELRTLQQFVGHISKSASSGNAAHEIAEVGSTNRHPSEPLSGDLQLTDDVSDFFADVVLVSDQRLLRRVTLSLTSRLPTKAEHQQIDAGGLPVFEGILQGIMTEDAFYDRLTEGFNDILLTLGYNGNGEDVLSYNHFQHTRHWYQKHSLDHLPENERQRARYQLADQYREALRREPLELLRHIVQNDLPFTEILTADYTMVSPYTARGYGLFEELQDQFRDAEDPFEFIPARLSALKHRDGKVQPTSDGLYPHAGLLTMFQYLRRYPTTETNRNRLRARMYYQHFLGVDIMSLAPRVGDAAAIDAAWEIPTMQAAECVVCHRAIDPIAGLFQDYYNEEGHYGPRRDGWFSDMFGPGREGTELPADQRGRDLQWLSQQTVSDPRFAIAMAEHVYYILMGRKVLTPPADIDDPHFAARRRAWLAQRHLIRHAARRFTDSDFNLKTIFVELILSPYYRADGLAVESLSPARLAELEDIGVVRLLGPEQMERKIRAIFGRSWGRLDDSYAILYGGIDSQEVTERLTDPSGAIGALQRILANDVACKHVAADFALPPDQRRLFPNVEPDIVPQADNAQAERSIRDAIVHLHQYVLGREDSPDDPEVDQTYRLFTGILNNAQAAASVEPVESYFCKSSGQEGPRDPDPYYTLRAWRAVVTYLLRQQEFLYE